MNTKLLGLTFLLLFFISCQSSKKIFLNSSPKEIVKNVTYKITHNYFIKNNFNLTEQENKRITNEDDFDKYFGKAFYMGDGGSPTKIDFNHEFVLAILLPETDLQTSIEVNKIEKTSNVLKFYYSIKKGNKNTFTTKPLLIVTVSKLYQTDVEFIKE